MIVKTLGIVIKKIKYGDTSIICNIYTKELGLIGFHVPGVFSKKAKINISYFQELTLLELSFNYNKNKNLQKISDISCKKSHNMTSIAQQAYFTVCSEILQLSIKEQEINEYLFDYLEQRFLNTLNAELNFWQLPSTMLNVLYFYGCSPNTNTYQNNYCLNFQEGIFCDMNTYVKLKSSPESAEIIFSLLTEQHLKLPYNHELRNQVINDLIIYYKIHVNDYFELKSRPIWQELMI